jgi:hypothetical protein
MIATGQPENLAPAIRKGLDQNTPTNHLQAQMQQQAAARQ